MPGPSSRKVALPTTSLEYHVLEWGGEDPALDHTVILIHGFLDLAWSWEATVSAGLGGRFHVVAPDMRGHGDSDRVGRGGYYHFPDYLADLRDLVPMVARRRVSLVGHSMGGSIAAYYAGAFPDTISKLAMLEGTGPPDMGGGGPDRIAAWLEAWQRIRARAPKGYATLAEAAEQLRRHDPLLEPAMALELAAHGTRQTAGGRFQFKHDPLHATPGPHGFQVEVAKRFWNRIRCPVLLVDGAESGLRHPPEEAARRTAAFPHSRTVTLDGAGHMMQRHQPGALARLLVDFLEEP